MYPLENRNDAITSNRRIDSDTREGRKVFLANLTFLIFSNRIQIVPSAFLCFSVPSFFHFFFLFLFFLYTARLGGSVDRFNAAIGIFRRGRKIELPCIHFGRRAAVLEFNGNEDTSIERTGPIVIL